MSEATRIPELFGSLVFNERTMEQYVPQSAMDVWRGCLKSGQPLPLSAANEIADAMKTWALEHGATHFTHWFQPLSGVTAEKHDSFINNAGGGTSMPILEMTDEAYFKDINTDLLGLFKCLREFGKVMVKQGYGRIINIASILGLVGENGVPVAGYQSAKGGVVNLTRCAATELATTGVTVNAICPGFFPSESNGPAEMEAMDSFIRVNTPMDRPGLPSELDKVGELEGAAVFLASDEASYVTGAILPVDGGWTCH